MNRTVLVAQVALVTTVMAACSDTTADPRRDDTAADGAIDAATDAAIDAPVDTSDDPGSDTGTTDTSTDGPSDAEDVQTDVADTARDVADDTVDATIDADAETDAADVAIDVDAPTDAADADADLHPDDRPHLVLVVLDDVGVEVVEPWASAFDAGAVVAATPTLDAIAARGLTFETAWATPTCSPTRAGLHTGLYPSRAGILGPAGSEPILAPDDPTLPRLLGAAGYRTGLLGKWHLGGSDAAPVTDGGWHTYVGQPAGVLPAYDDWIRTSVDTDGTVTSAPTTTYATTAVVDDALAWAATQPTDAPWLVMLAFNAPHTPHHLPPADLRPGIPDSAIDADGDGTCDDDGACMRAMLTAVDTELGRFVAAFDALANDRDTVLVVLGDNGTNRTAIQAPWTRAHAKGTVYEGGLRVPLWVDGPDTLVTRGTAPGLAHASVDVYATLLELGGAPVPDGIDGVSLVPVLADPDATVRSNLFCDGRHTIRMVETEAAAARDARYKVLVPDVDAPDVWECFDLADDPNERDDLRAAGTAPPACEDLRATIDTIRSR